MCLIFCMPSRSPVRYPRSRRLAMMPSSELLARLAQRSVVLRLRAAGESDSSDFFVTNFFAKASSASRRFANGKSDRFFPRESTIRSKMIKRAGRSSESFAMRLAAG